MTDNLLGMPRALLPADPAADVVAGLREGPGHGSPADVGANGDGMPFAARESVAAAYPASSLAWALLAEAALDADRPVAAYAYARTGYHRGLDALRKAGWRGQGPIPWEHEPNRGFLRALAALARAARVIGEHEEETRCGTFLRDSSRAAADALGF